MRSWTVLILLLLAWTLLPACGSLTPESTGTLSPLESQGRSVFETNCSRCHAASGDTVVVGPSLAGVATRGESRIEGLNAGAYIRNSILEPGAYTVSGFPENVMPGDFEEQLSLDELDAVVAYLLTLE